MKIELPDLWVGVAIGVVGTLTALFLLVAGACVLAA